jgi:hypothetical protein
VRESGGRVRSAEKKKKKKKKDCGGDPLMVNHQKDMMRVGFEPTPFRTSE